MKTRTCTCGGTMIHSDDMENPFAAGDDKTPFWQCEECGVILQDRMNTEICPHCGKSDIDTDNKGCQYHYLCSECQGTWEVDYEEITTFMRWTDRSGVNQVRPLGPSEPLREAAPELLAACRVARDLIADLDPYALHTIEYDQVDAAIAHATGEKVHPL